MLILIILSALTSFLAFLLGFLIYRKEKTSKVKQLFFTMTLLLGLWALLSIFMYAAKTKADFIFWYKLGYSFHLLYLPAFLQFTLVLTGHAPKRYALIYLVYVPCLVCILTFLFDTDYWNEFIRVKNTWQFNYRYLDGKIMYFIAVLLGYYTVSTILYFRKANTSITIKDKKKFRILGFFLIFIITATTIEEVILPVVFNIPSRGLDLLVKFCWLGGIGFLIDRYDFLRAPVRLEDVAFTNFPGLIVFILDPEYRILRLNKEAELFFNTDAGSLEGGLFPELHPSVSKLLAELEKEKQEKLHSVSGIIEIENKSLTKLLLDLKICTLYNNTNQQIGYIAVGKQFRGKRELQSVFTLSTREIEVIEEIIRGRTNIEIAENLSITEKTVKTHITHIFAKLGVENRIQLFYLLKENHFITGQPADKNLLIFDKSSQ